jgi:methylated-DNA-[protein]-cysteine S-methyltransferase
MRDDTVFQTTPSPVGELLLAASAGALVGVYFEPHRWGPSASEVAGWRRDDADGVLAAARTQLAAYFAGELTAFDLPLAPRGTDFQQRVWGALRAIPYGATTSYGELARRLGDPHATRAVGAANGRNPLSIVVPCHRVIGADGALTGFGGGIERKRWLLAHEQRHAPAAPAAQLALL